MPLKALLYKNSGLLAARLNDTEISRYTPYKTVKRILQERTDFLKQPFFAFLWNTICDLYSFDELVKNVGF